jgi:hypothetical protein
MVAQHRAPFGLFSSLHTRAHVYIWANAATTPAYIMFLSSYYYDVYNTRWLRLISWFLFLNTQRLFDYVSKAERERRKEKRFSAIFACDYRAHRPPATATHTHTSLERGDVISRCPFWKGGRIQRRSIYKKEERGYMRFPSTQCRPYTSSSFWVEHVDVTKSMKEFLSTCTYYNAHRKKKKKKGLVCLCILQWPVVLAQKILIAL